MAGSKKSTATTPGGNSADAGAAPVIRTLRKSKRRSVVNVEDAEDADVPAMAVKGLCAATAASIAAGMPQVVERDNRLVRVHADGREEFIKQLPPRKRFSQLFGTNVIIFGRKPT